MSALNFSEKKEDDENQQHLSAERGNPSVTNSSSKIKCNIISSNHEYVNASNWEYITVILLEPWNR